MGIENKINSLRGKIRGFSHNQDTFSQCLKETYRSDGTLATRFDGNKLIQYDRKGQVVSVEQMDPFKQVTYRDGEIAAIAENRLLGRHTITLYNKGLVTNSINLNENDQVNFKDGYLSSIIKHSSDQYGRDKQITETQYGKNGKISSVIHKAQMDNFLSKNMWVVTSQSNYHDNGKLASVVTYKQKYHQKLNTTEAESYPASIEQYDENGKRLISVRLTEKDEVSFNGDKISSITRRNEDGQPQSTTNYDLNGMVVNILNYDKQGKVISSVDYDKDGRPIKALQEGMENYQDIFAKIRGNGR